MTARARLAAAWRSKALRRTLFAAFLLLVGVLLFRYARNVDWPAVLATLRGYSARTLAVAIGAALLSFLLYGGYDLLARAWVGHRLAAWRTHAIATISYVFNLNLGAAIGGAGFRYRLYTRAGLAPADVTRVLAFSVTTNWLGYVLVAGLVFASGRLELPGDWAMSATALRVLGVALAAVPVAWLAACAWRGGSTWTVRGHAVELPRLGIAVLQLLVSAANWMVISAIVFALLPRGVGYADVLGTLLLAAIAGAIAHIPAGIGALEAVFVAMLGPRLGEAPVLAALLAYRAVYYIGPLLLAAAAYAAMEGAAKRAAARGATPAAPAKRARPRRAPRRKRA